MHSSIQSTLNFDVSLVLLVSIDFIISDDSCCKRRFAIENNLVIPLAIHGIVIIRCIQTLCHVPGVNRYIWLRPAFCISPMN